jgi:predicted dehydrogenase/RimJ/RimL family protein N-acetyltransferase
VVGQGSIGRRHAQILLGMGHEVVVHEPDPLRQPPAGTVRVDTLNEAVARADAAVIASPSSEHARQARLAIERPVPVLVEKPLATDAARATELDCLARERGVSLSVAMNLRYHPGVLAVRTLIETGAVGRVLRASAWCGSWLPGWRPGSDYRSGYSARAELGGGVLLDVAIHELDYLLWLLGPATSASALAGRVSSFELDVEDVASVTLELLSGAVADIVVDYFDRSYHRGCRIVGELATVHWSWEHERVTLLRPERPPAELTVSSDVGQAYHRQLESFLAVVRDGAAVEVPASQARDVLAVIDAARVSARRGRRVPLARPILRSAERADSDSIRAWRNDPETRRWSRVGDEVSTDEHERWFDRILADPTTTIWIAEVDSSPVGQVRVTRDAGGSAELHITVAPDVRGGGVGTAMLVEAAGRALSESDVKLLVAHVKRGNEASRRAFVRAGFEPVGEDGAGLQRLERAPCR